MTETAIVPPRDLPGSPSALTEAITRTIPVAIAVSDRRRAAIDAGWALIRSGDYHGAIHVLNKAKPASPKDPRVFLGLGLSHYWLAQYDPAVVSLQRALRLDAGLDQAHTLLGDVAFMRDHLDDAVRHYKAALTLNPNDVSIQDGLFRVRRAQQLEGGFARVVTPHFIVKCGKASRESLQGLADRLEALYRRIGQQLSSPSGEAIIVILYTDRRFQDLTDSPSWAGGLFDGKIHVAAQRVLLASPEADAALAHEYAHALVHRIAGGHAPTWLDEGLALYFEGRTPAWSDTIIDSRVTELTPLHALHGSFLSLPPREATLAYAESASATRALISRYGWPPVQNLLETLAGPVEFHAAFETVLKEPYHAFEASWVAVQSHRSL
ncbi:MAG: tetratricopeptide repeat protein [Nitrospirota bacterium]|nr:tetratricopeptide repeat protein [Nitrospirota bacterium]